MPKPLDAEASVRKALMECARRLQGMVSLWPPSNHVVTVNQLHEDIKARAESGLYCQACCWVHLMDPVEVQMERNRGTDESFTVTCQLTKEVITTDHWSI